MAAASSSFSSQFFLAGRKGKVGTRPGPHVRGMSNERGAPVEKLKRGSRGGDEWDAHVDFGEGGDRKVDFN